MSDLDREEEMRWLAMHQDELALLPPDEWLAIDGDALIAHGQVLMDVIAEAKALGHPYTFITATPPTGGRMG